MILGTFIKILFSQQNDVNIARNVLNLTSEFLKINYLRLLPSRSVDFHASKMARYQIIKHENIYVSSISVLDSQFKLFQN